MFRVFVAQFYVPFNLLPTMFLWVEKNQISEKWPVPIDFFSIDKHNFPLAIYVRFVFAKLPPKSLSLGNLHFIIKIFLIKFLPNNQNQCWYYAKGTLITQRRDPQTCAFSIYIY